MSNRQINSRSLTPLASCPESALASIHKTDTILPPAEQLHAEDLQSNAGLSAAQAELARLKRQMLGPGKSE